jgi:NAD(P)-dependent dehydrogenase (short-subunit alcohol dehydrogenase family)
MDLNGRVAVVTGAASGIGFALAQRFAAEKMRLVVADVEPDPLERARAALAEVGADVRAVCTDVADPDAVGVLADTAYEQFGVVHLLCNNAGVSFHWPIWEATLADWEWVLGVNLWGVIHGVRAFVPRMLEGGQPGHIVNTASGAGLFCNPGLGVYSVAKHGVVALSETLVQDLRAQGSGIGVSVLCPSYTSTNIAASERNRPERLGGEPAELRVASRALQVPAGSVAEMLSPEDVASRVQDAVLDDRFWIFTHPHTTAIVGRWASAMAEGGTFFGGDDKDLRSR